MALGRHVFGSFSFSKVKGQFLYTYVVYNSNGVASAVTCNRVSRERGS